MKCWKSLLMVTRVSHCVVEHVRNSTDWQSNKGLSHPGWTSTVCSLLSSSALLCCAVLVHHSGDFPVKSKLCISCVNYVAYRIYRYLYHEIIWYKERQVLILILMYFVFVLYWQLHLLRCTNVMPRQCCPILPSLQLDPLHWILILFLFFFFPFFLYFFFFFVVVCSFFFGSFFIGFCYFFLFFLY